MPSAIPSSDDGLERCTPNPVNSHATLTAALEEARGALEAFVAKMQKVRINIANAAATPMDSRYGLPDALAYPDSRG